MNNRSKMEFELTEGMDTQELLEQLVPEEVELPWKGLHLSCWKKGHLPGSNGDCEDCQDYFSMAMEHPILDYVLFDWQQNHRNGYSYMYQARG